MTKSQNEYVIVCFLCSEFLSRTSAFCFSKGDKIGGGGVNGLSGLADKPLLSLSKNIMMSTEIKQSLATRNQKK